MMSTWRREAAATAVANVMDQTIASSLIASEEEQDIFNDMKVATNHPLQPEMDSLTSREEANSGQDAHLVKLVRSGLFAVNIDGFL
jgi:hypothetical protein